MNLVNIDTSSINMSLYIANNNTSYLEIGSNANSITIGKSTTSILIGGIKIDGYPPGSIISYIGKTDITGWILCDGVTRTATDNRYAALAILLGGSNTANSVTPPNLKDKFLCGQSNTNSTPLQTGGQTSVTLTTANLPAHNHAITVTDSGHTHANTASQGAHDHGITASVAEHTHFDRHLKDFSGSSSGIGGKTGSLGGSDEYRTFSRGILVTASSNNQTPIITATKVRGYATLTASSANTGSVTPTAINTIPPYSSVNYLIKL